MRRRAFILIDKLMLRRVKELKEKLSSKKDQSIKPDISIDANSPEDLIKKAGEINMN
jgi:hypothetical protein